MTVRFLRRSDSDIDTLYGKRFPSEEIQALWNMITEDIKVEWVATGVFVLTRLRVDIPGGHIGTIQPIAMISADAGHDYECWACAIQKLIL